MKKHGREIVGKREQDKWRNILKRATEKKCGGENSEKNENEQVKNNIKTCANGRKYEKEKFGKKETGQVK